MTWLSKVQSSTWFLLQPFPALGKVGKCHFPFSTGGWKKDSSLCSVFHWFSLLHFPFWSGQSWEISLKHRHLQPQPRVLTASRALFPHQPAPMGQEQGPHTYQSVYDQHSQHVCSELISKMCTQDCTEEGREAGRTGYS